MLKQEKPNMDFFKLHIKARTFIAVYLYH